MAVTIAVDFNGVIHTYSRGWAEGTTHDKPTPGIDRARRLMESYSVFRSRSREGEQVMPDLGRGDLNMTVDEHGLTLATQMGQLRVTNRRLPPRARIDDQGVRFASWPTTLAALREVL